MYFQLGPAHLSCHTPTKLSMKFLKPRLPLPEASSTPFLAHIPSVLGLVVSPQNSCIEVLTPGPQKVTLFGNGFVADVTSKDVVIVEQDEPLTQCDWCPYKKKKGNLDADTHTGRMPWKGEVRDQDDAAEAKECQRAPAIPEAAGRPYSLRRNQLAGTFILDFWSLDCENIDSRCSSPCLWYFVWAVPGH